MPTRTHLVLALAALALPACSSSPPANAGTDAAADAADAADAASPVDTVTPVDVVPPMDAVVADAAVDAVTDAGFVPGPHEALPVFPDQGGPRLHHPALVTITFAGDPRRAQLEAYASWLVGSRWLAAVGAEYGVGAGTIAGAVQRPEAAPRTVTRVNIENLIAGGILDGSIPTPPGGMADALYLLYYPSTTSITERCGRFDAVRSCDAFGAIHTDGSAMGLSFAYAVMPDCGSSDRSLTALETVEYNASHEIIEAATDPFSFSHPAYELHDDPTDPFFTLVGCEVETADLCALSPAILREDGHVAQRNWSNAAAAAGGDPCIPADPAHPYFGVTAAPTTVQHVAPGATVSYDLHAWSTAPVADWTLSTRLLPPLDGSAALAATTRFSSTTTNNGRTVTLQVTVPSGARAGSAATILVVSTHSATDYHVWPLSVVTP